MLEALARQIIGLMISRRSALTINQIKASALGYKAHLVDEQVAQMIRDGHLVTMTEKGKTFYQMTLAGYKAWELR